MAVKGATPRIGRLTQLGDDRGRHHLMIRLKSGHACWASASTSG